MERENEGGSLVQEEQGHHGSHEHHGHEKIAIQIDRKRHEVHSLTTGKELYLIGDVGSRYGLYREADGDEKDVFVRDGDEQIHVHEGEHFYSKQIRFCIVVNAAEETVTGDHLSYEEIIKLAFSVTPTAGSTAYTVAYENAGGIRSEGTLTAGHRLHIQDGTVIDVTQTNKS